MVFFCDEAALGLKAREWSLGRAGEWEDLSGKSSQLMMSSYTL